MTFSQWHGASYRKSVRVWGIGTHLYYEFTTSVTEIDLTHICIFALKFEILELLLLQLFESGKIPNAEGIARFSPTKVWHMHEMEPNFIDFRGYSAYSEQLNIDLTVIWIESKMSAVFLLEMSFTFTNIQNIHDICQYFEHRICRNI